MNWLLRNEYRLVAALILSLMGLFTYRQHREGEALQRWADRLAWREAALDGDEPLPEEGRAAFRRFEDIRFLPRGAVLVIGGCAVIWVMCRQASFRKRESALRKQLRYMKLEAALVGVDALESLLLIDEQWMAALTVTPEERSAFLEEQGRLRSRMKIELATAKRELARKIREEGFDKPDRVPPGKRPLNVNAQP